MRNKSHFDEQMQGKFLHPLQNIYVKSTAMWDLHRIYMESFTSDNLYVSVGCCINKVKLPNLRLPGDGRFVLDIAILHLESKMNPNRRIVSEAPRTGWESAYWNEQDGSSVLNQMRVTELIKLKLWAPSQDGRSHSQGKFTHFCFHDGNNMNLASPHCTAGLTW